MDRLLARRPHDRAAPPARPWRPTWARTTRRLGCVAPTTRCPWPCAAALGPIATTSANRHGAPPMTTAGALAAELPGVALVLDAGTCDGAASTVVDSTGEVPKLLRAGSITWDEILAVAADP